ncbi:MAG TPA: hypothetical protein VHU91_03610 [Mycobacteriales bacterium]|jgi:hypothetical protein|nr:hypothetical protein [Mycobacteriales bacterium]
MSPWPTDYSGTALFPLDATGLPSNEPIAALDGARAEWVRLGQGGRETRLPVGEDIRQATRRPGQKTGLFHVYGGVAGDIVGQGLLGGRVWVAPPDQAPQWWPFEPSADPSASSLPESAWRGDFPTHARSLCAGLSGLDPQGPRGPLAPSQLLERSWQLLGPYSKVMGPRPPEDAMGSTFLVLGRSPDIGAAQLIAPYDASYAVKAGGRTGFEPLRELTLDPRLPWQDAEERLQGALGASTEAREKLRLYVVAVDPAGNFVAGQRRSDGSPEWSLGPTERPNQVFSVESAAPLGAVGDAALNASWLVARSDELRKDHKVLGLPGRMTSVAGQGTLLRLPPGATEALAALAEAGQSRATPRRLARPSLGGNTPWTGRGATRR